MTEPGKERAHNRTPQSTNPHIERLIGGLVSAIRIPSEDRWLALINGDSDFLIGKHGETMSEAVGAALCRLSEDFISRARSQEPVRVSDGDSPYEMPDVPLQPGADGYYSDRKVVVGRLVEVVRRSDDFMASVAGDRRVWGCGPTVNAAVGEVAVSHGEFLIAAAQSLPDGSSQPR